MSGPHKLPDEASIDRLPILDARVPNHVAATSADPIDSLPLLEETLQVTKQNIVSGTVRVSTRTETHDDIIDVALDRNIVEVTRVPIGQVVDVVPIVRTQGDTTIVPVFEERFVVVKHIYLKEELHIERRIEQDVTRVPVSLRRQTAIVQRFDANGVEVDNLSSSSSEPRKPGGM